MCVPNLHLDAATPGLRANLDVHNNVVAGFEELLGLNPPRLERREALPYLRLYRLLAPKGPGGRASLGNELPGGQPLPLMFKQQRPALPPRSLDDQLPPEPLVKPEPRP